MKFPKELIAGSLALGMMVTSARAEDPLPVPIVCTGLVVVDQKELTDTDVQICVLPPDLTNIEGEETVNKIDDAEVPTEWVIRTGTDDPLIFASSSGQINTTASATPAITTDAGKDEASTAKAAGISAPTKSITSVGKRTSAVVKSGRVFLTH